MSIINRQTGNRINTGSFQLIKLVNKAWHMFGRTSRRKRPGNRKQNNFAPCTIFSRIQRIHPIFGLGMYIYRRDGFTNIDCHCLSF